MKSISVSNLSYAYFDDLYVIKDISASFASHKIHTLVGLNGSGKTTLIKLLSGLFKPKKGQVFLGDQDLHSIDYLTRSKHIAYVRQGTSSGDDHYVKDYLSFGMTNKFSWYQSPSHEHFEMVINTAEKFKITDLLYKKMNELSGGQKQIVMICRAFIQNTDIIILDEPTSALDFKNQSLVLKLLKEIVKNHDKTIILSTHNPNHALYLESDVLLIHDGRLVEVGPAVDLINVDKLKAIYGDTITYSNELQYKEVTLE
jgi:iron complex transport system ATP-binding protein